MKKGGISMSIYRLDAAARRILQLAGILPGLALACIGRFLPAPLPILMYAAAVICTAGGEIWLHFWLRTMRCEVTPERITLFSGVLLRRRRCIPRRCIRFLQTACLYPGGLRFLTVYAYGGRLTVPFLGREDCQALAALLREGVFADAP